MGFVQKEGFKVTALSYIGAAVGYINKILLFPNFLNPAQVGLANLLINISVIYAQISALGLINVVLKFFPFFHNEEKKHSGFLFWVYFSGTLGFCLVTVLFIVFKPSVSGYYQKNSPLLMDYYYYLIPLGITTLYNNLTDVYLRSIHKTSMPAFINEVLLRVMITFSISMYALNLLNFEQFMVVYVAINCLTGLIIIIYTLWLKKWYILPMNSQILKRLSLLMIVFSIFAFLGNMSNVLIANIDALMLAGMISLEQTGIYTTVFFITTIMVIPYRSMLKVSSPLVAQFWKRKSMTEMEQLYKKFSLVNYVLASGIFLFIWSSIDLIFHFMPKEYSIGKYVFLFLSVGKLFDIAAGLNGVILLTSRKYRFDLLFSLLLILLTVYTNYVLIPLYGINGAALATMITIIVFNLLRLWFVWHYFKIQPFQIHFITVTLLVSIALSISYFIEADNIFISSLIKMTVTLVVFIIPVYLLRISTDLNQFIDKYFKRIPNPKL